MPATSLDNQILALVGLDGQTCVQLKFVETGSTGVVFETPPTWLPGTRQSVPVPYRIQATVKDGIPFDAGVVKAILEWQWRQQGLEAPGKPGWFEIDSVALELALSGLALTVTMPADALMMVNRLVTDAHRISGSRTSYAGELWIAAQALWPLTGASSFTGSPAESAADAMLELIRQTSLSGGGEHKQARITLDFFLTHMAANGALGTDLFNARLQRYLGNPNGASDSLVEFLKGLERAVDSGVVDPSHVEAECVRLLLTFKRDWVPTNEDCPELLSSLSLSFREALITICEQRFDGDLQLLFWAKKQMVQSFFGDPTYRKYILGGMAVCLGVAAYVSVQVVLVLLVVGGMGYFVSKKSR